MLFVWSASGCDTFFKSLWLSVQLVVCVTIPFLVGRNEVTKLKFEGKIFHIYANQKEVRA